MKVIPTEEFIKMLKIKGPSLLAKSYVDELFETYGDDYFKDDSSSPYKKETDNYERRKLLNNVKKSD